MLESDKSVVRRDGDSARRKGWGGVPDRQTDGSWQMFSGWWKAQLKGDCFDSLPVRVCECVSVCEGMTLRVC